MLVRPLSIIAAAVVGSTLLMPACHAQTTLASSSQTREPSANTQSIPKQILKTGISLNSPLTSPNSLQLSNTIGLTPVLERIRQLRMQVESFGDARTLESLSARQDLLEATQKAELIIQKANLEIDFTLSAIEAEYQLYCEILATYTNDRDKAIARTNAISFITNGILWAICEALAIPTYKNSDYAISSGILGIQAGVVPSIASMYTLKLINGKRRTSEVEPNMLAKLFNYPTTPDIEYPKSVWLFLNQVPATESGGKKRMEQLVDRWIDDANIPSFSDRTSRKQLDVITASVAQRKGLSISTLNVRSVMLQQLGAEIAKMKRLLLELTMTLQGDKQLTANDSLLERRLSPVSMVQE